MDEIERLRRSFQRVLRIRARSRSKQQKQNQSYLPYLVPKSAKKQKKEKKVIKDIFSLPKIQKKPMQTKFPNEVINKYNLSNQLIIDIQKKLDVYDYRKNIKKHNKDLKELAMKVCKEKISQGYINALFNKDKNRYQGTMVYYNNILIGFTNFYRKPSRKTNKINLICVNRKHYLKGLPLGKILIDLVVYDAKKYRKTIDFVELEAIPEAISFYKSYGFQVIVKDHSSQLTIMKYKIK